MDEIRDTRSKQMFRMDDEYLNGYARLCGMSATGVYLSLCRHADQEQRCFPSKRLIGEELGMSERTVYSAIKVLEEWGIIEVLHQGRKPDGSFKNLLYVLKDKRAWVKKPPTANVADGKKQQTPTANDDRPQRQPLPNKDAQGKDAHKKVASQSDAGVIVSIIDAFAPVNPVYEQWYKNTNQRAAVDRLLVAHGADRLTKVITLLTKTNAKAYFPTITTPVELERDWAKLKSKLEQEKDKTTGVTRGRGLAN